jgi:hypothetical protein
VAKDLPYNIVGNSGYLPIALKAATKRLMNTVPLHLSPSIARAFTHRAINSVYAVVLERNGKPEYVVKNLQFHSITPVFQRVLRIVLQ